MTWIRRFGRFGRAATGEVVRPPLDATSSLDDLRAAIDAVNAAVASLRGQLERRLDGLGSVESSTPAGAERLGHLEEQVAAIRTMLERIDPSPPSAAVGDGGPDPTQTNGHRPRAEVGVDTSSVRDVVVAPRGRPEESEASDSWLLPVRTAASDDPADLADGTAAVAQLEVLRAKGARRLVVPPPAMEWFMAHPKLVSFVEGRYRVLSEEGTDERSYGLWEPPEPGQHGWRGEFDGLIGRLRDQLRREPVVLDWGSGGRLEERRATGIVFEPPFPAPTLPYLDDSVDVVAVLSDEPGRLPEARRVASEAVAILSGDGLTLEHLGRQVTRRSVTVVVPVHNAVEYTRCCLAALEGTLPPSYDVEVLVVDDASTDETPALLSRLGRELGWLRVIRNDENQGFIGSCNRAASEARGDVLVLLNNDTVPLPGWLEALCGTFDEHPAAGAVGGKLLYPDGRLQEAGGVIFSDGSGANFGRGDPEVDYALFDHVRPVDYCSGALLATPRDLFQSIGGFDSRYRPAYYEDTDYCFSVRERGYQVLYQPRSAVVHFEGGTSGTDVSRGTKRFQVVNREKFREKWATALQRQPPPVTTGFDRSTWHSLAVRGAA